MGKHVQKQQKQIKHTSNASKGKLPWWKTVAGLLGIGLSCVAFIATFFAFNSNTDIRSRAMEFSDSRFSIKRCNLTLKPQVLCAPGFQCIDEAYKGALVAPKNGKWGRCVQIPTPPVGKRCNMTINPPVSCEKGFVCVSDKEWSNTNSPLLGQWGHCTEEMTVSPTPVRVSAKSCYNRVIISGSQYYWPDSCRGNTQEDMVCAQSLVRLTAEEIAKYHAWISRGRPSIAGCEQTTPTPSP
jgi:hypothetical protein